MKPKAGTLAILVIAVIFSLNAGSVLAGVKILNVEAKIRFRQADQKVVEKLLAAVPKDIDLEKLYGLKAVPSLPVVDMVVKETSVAASK